MTVHTEEESLSQQNTGKTKFRERTTHRRAVSLLAFSGSHQPCHPPHTLCPEHLEPELAAGAQWHLRCVVRGASPERGLLRFQSSVWVELFKLLAGRELSTHRESRARRNKTECPLGSTDQPRAKSL